jgi:hypothetical protein
MITDEIRENLALLQADYTKVNGSPFADFYCPLLCRDEDVELCLGHVTSKTWKNCCRAVVVQRGDIDHWYGSIAEAEFGTFLEAREVGLGGVVTDEKLLKQVKPKILVEREECRLYPYPVGHLQGVGEPGGAAAKHENIESVLHRHAPPSSGAW